MTNKQKSERDEYIQKLRETLKPGDTLHTVLRSVSRSGMQRVIDVYRIYLDDKGEVKKDWLSYWVAKACGYAFQDQRGKPEGVKVSGCGMDMGFAVVYDVGRVLWPDGFECPGKGCASNDHSNGDRDYTPGLHTGKQNPCEVCHHHGEDCTGTTHAHHHMDGGYALKQEWI